MYVFCLFFPQNESILSNCLIKDVNHNSSSMYIRSSTMNSCAGCFLKHIFDSNVPIYFNCSHNEESSCVITIKNNLLRFYYLLMLCIFAMFMGYSYLLPTNYCSAYTLRCMLVLSDFIYSLIGITVFFFQLLSVKRTVLSLNGWVMLYEHKDQFCIQYESLQKKTIMLKRKRIFFTIVIYSLIFGDAVFTLKFLYVSDYSQMKLILEMLCAYFQMAMYFEGIQHISVIHTIYTYFSNSVQNILLLTLSPSDRFCYYKSVGPDSGRRGENLSSADDLQKLNKFCSAFSKNVKSINMIFRPLAIFWFSEVTFHLIINFYIIVNADYENYKLKIDLMVCFLVNSITLMVYVVIKSENVNKMVSNIFLIIVLTVS